MYYQNELVLSIGNKHKKSIFVTIVTYGAIGLRFHTELKSTVKAKLTFITVSKENV